jgi:aquaporin Z
MSQFQISDKMAKTLAPFIIEFIGTFFLTATIAFNLINFLRSDNVFEMQAALGIGTCLVSVVYAGGHLSGAHYNPSITIAVWMSRRNKITTLDAAIYIGVQIVAAFLAGMFQWAILSETFRITPASNVPLLGAVIVEWFWTFLLDFVVLQTATTKPQAGNSFFGIAIGFAVLSGICSAGYVSGGALNPAILLGLNFSDAIAHADISRLEYTWIYLIGGTLGGVSAGALFHLTNRDEYTDTQHISLYSADATAVSDVAATKRDKKHLREGAEMGSDGEYEEVDQTSYLLKGTSRP